MHESATHPAVKLASRLIGISSENPDVLESEIIRYISGWLKEASVEHHLQEVAPGRHNLIATVRGRGQRKVLTLIAHCDTVPVGSGWTRDPFAGTIEDGRLYGRGASDMKGGLAAALYAVREALHHGPPPGDVTVIVSVDEEGPGMLGVIAAIEGGYVDASTMVIAPEPTSLNIVRKHRGVMWYDVVARGKMSHAGHAERGVDANHALAEAICELKAAVNAIPFNDPLVGGALLSIGKMGGGTKTNVVPNMARAEIDFRVPPPMTAEHAALLVKKAVWRGVARVPGASAEVTHLGLQRPPVETPEDAPVVGLLANGCETVTGRLPKILGYVAYTDAAVVSWLCGNRNAVLFGPGNLEQAHSIDEWAPADEIAQCAEIFKRCALGL
ncbi:MAG: M20 family metallopeptidase [Phycisphaerae bacterium]